MLQWGFKFRKIGGNLKNKVTILPKNFFLTKKKKKIRKDPWQFINCDISLRGNIFIFQIELIYSTKLYRLEFTGEHTCHKNFILLYTPKKKKNKEILYYFSREKKE